MRAIILAQETPANEKIEIEGEALGLGDIRIQVAGCAAVGDPALIELVRRRFETESGSESRRVTAVGAP
ncbi:MAG: hypothetical protein K2V38_00020 [Gemmataceae bacterium]|nr:hypothetical protein [Gemmataceae bacterium]